ncbi:Plasma membrane proteolipid 3 [Erysiphe neolycopersici]|uniref:Plasma membrane proteolipid 3 n=1 Tax=Erysiphe neolycopersici TaxID=212602 RepID=A0A420HM63_9PEZI|nr:Plasma membrane proteolipid 3 [Erysiphe neolycopersici]
MALANALISVVLSLFFPPLGVFIVAGCSTDLLINILLTLLGFFPGIVHALYVQYIYYDRREKSQAGRFIADRAPGVYSERVQNGGHGYGTII